MSCPECPLSDNCLQRYDLDPEAINCIDGPERVSRLEEEHLGEPLPTRICTSPAVYDAGIYGGNVLVDRELESAKPQ